MFNVCWFNRNKTLNVILVGMTSVLPFVSLALFETTCVTGAQFMLLSPFIARSSVGDSIFKKGMKFGFY